MKKLVIILIIIVGVWYLFFREKPQTEVVQPEETAVTEETQTAEENLNVPSSVSVETQKAGNTVTANVVLDEMEGYVVIHKNENDHPGMIIGASSFLKAGKHEGVVIELTEPTESGSSYFAMIHIDDGDDNFAFPGNDVPLTDEAENFVMAAFTVEAPTVEAATTKEPVAETEE